MLCNDACGSSNKQNRAILFLNSSRGSQLSQINECKFHDLRFQRVAHPTVNLRLLDQNLPTFDTPSYSILWTKASTMGHLNG